MKKKIIIFGAVIILAILTVSGTAIATPNNNLRTLNKYKKMSEEQIITDLENLDKENMVKEIEKVYSEIFDSNLDFYTTVPFATAFYSRITEYSEDELVDLILDKNNNLFFRVVILQLYSENEDARIKKSSKGNDSIRHLLFNEKIEREVKENIIVGLDFTDEKGIEILASIAKDTDDMLAFQAIKKLNQIDSVKALEIAKQILENYEEETPEKVNAALSVTAEDFRRKRIKKSFKSETQKQKQEFIRICEDIIANTTEEDKLHDCAIFSLSEMTDPDAITSIVNNDKIDDIYKVYAIDQNYLTLIDMISGNYSKSHVKTVCQAMNIYPIKEVSKTLLEVQNKLTFLTSKDNIDVESTLKNIRQKGENANPKWNEFYYGKEVEK